MYTQAVQIDESNAHRIKLEECTGKQGCSKQLPLSNIGQKKKKQIPPEDSRFQFNGRVL